ncbi:Adrenodoxin, mitochondrial [Halocaridina rubra]|uniref:Adrenodoxin, mitochondrial n=1 Tax=Halocaridina rubra TaxID=373956 RepID=A0AAN8XM28_HALRR
MSLSSMRLATAVLRNIPRTSINALQSYNTVSKPSPVLSSCNPKRPLSSLQVNRAKEWVEVTFETSDGASYTVQGKEGDNLLDVVVNNNVDLDGFGACEGTLSCSTCHLIFKKEDFDKIEDPCTDEELDMLDLAYGLSDTSRLGCQVCLTKALHGLKVIVPEGTADARQI